MAAAGRMAYGMVQPTAAGEAAKHGELPVPQKITKSVKSMVEAAKREIEEIEPAEAVKLAGRDDVVLVDIRDIRELGRDGRVPGAFHVPRGMLEFWIDP